MSTPTESEKQERAERLAKAAPEMYDAINAALTTHSHKDDQCPAFKLLRAAKEKVDGVRAKE